MADENKLADIAKEYLDLWQQQWSGFLKNQNPSDFKLWEELLKQNYQTRGNANEQPVKTDRKEQTCQGYPCDAVVKFAKHLDDIQSRLNALEKRFEHLQPQGRKRVSKPTQKAKTKRAKRVK